jgi:hypothetical protein
VTDLRPGCGKIVPALSQPDAYPKFSTLKLLTRVPGWPLRSALEGRKIMKKRLSIGVVLTLIVLALVLPAAVQAGYQFRFSGDTAFASFSDFDGCVYTDVSVFATDGRQQSPPGRPGKSSWADIYISRYDSCNDWVPLLSAYGGAALAGPDFQVARKLNSATLDTTINVYDYVNDNPFDVAVDLDWAGSGDLNRGRSQWQSHSGNCKFHSRWQGSWRFATASGSVSDGSTNYASQSSGYAEIQSVRSGEAAIGCN